MADLAVVAGAGGFIGRHLSRHLADSGMEVLGLDRIPFDEPGCRCETVDLTDRGATLSILAGLQPRWVFNLTGVIDHTVDWPGQREIVDQHWLSMMNLVEALHSDPPEAFVNLGSSDEYGDAPAPQREDLRERPIAPYSAAKAAATHYLQMLHRRTGFPASVARLFLVYGPGQDARRLIPMACLALLRGERLPASPGLQRRDFLYIEDAVRGLIALACRPGTRGEVFNLASGQAISIRQVLETLQALVGRGEIDFGARPLRQGEIMDLYADIQRIVVATGWCPTIPLEEGLRRTEAYYRQLLTPDGA